MKKIILVVLMIVIVATPCFAQEIEPDGLFSLDGTLWRVWDVVFITLPYFLLFDAKKVGFIHDSVYLCNEDEQRCRVSPSSYYINLPFVSIAVVNGINSSGWNFQLYIIQPIGMGLHMAVGYHKAFKGYPPYISAVMGILYKINDNWIPPEEE